MATGRSDFPNQVNNVLGFPFIFRGALDVRASAINEEMKMAAVNALASLTKEIVPETVFNAYGGESFEFGRNYIIPKPFDPRVLWYVAPAVAKAAIETGVAREKIKDWNSYEEEIIRVMVHKAQKSPKRVVFPEGEEEKIIRAAHVCHNDNIAKPILLGNSDKIKEIINSLDYDEKEFEIFEPETCSRCEGYAQAFFNKRRRKGATLRQARELMKAPIYYGSMMCDQDDADALISGLTTDYPNTIKPALQCVGIKDGFKLVSGLYIVLTKKDVFFFADTTVNVNPNSSDLAEIAISAADIARAFEVNPKVAMLSFSNFGSAKYPESVKVSEAVKIVKKLRPDLTIDGEMQADTAVIPEILNDIYPFSDLKGKANVLVFPDLNSGNIAYKLMARIGQATVIGPILMGMKKSVHVLQRGATVDDIINMTAVAVVGATNRLKQNTKP
jgi:malate dehydrogenase (oxaloacetate-decarboxylating)(NADP+)